MYEIVIALFAGIFILIIPTGIGLLLLSNKNINISRLQILTLSYFFGIFLMVFFFVLLERIGEFKLSWHLVALICLMSFLGFIK